VASVKADVHAALRKLGIQPSATAFEQLMRELDVSDAQLRELMRFWLDRFGLDGPRDYQRNVDQTADFAQQRRYFVPL
jgi:hypothetical protein